ncbi:hypothetical protein D3C86_1084700 [compost metagenome]
MELLDGLEAHPADVVGVLRSVGAEGFFHAREAALLGQRVVEAEHVVAEVLLAVEGRLHELVDRLHGGDRPLLGVARLGVGAQQLGELAVGQGLDLGDPLQALLEVQVDLARDVVVPHLVEDGLLGVRLVEAIEGVLGEEAIHLAEVDGLDPAALADQEVLDLAVVVGDEPAAHVRLGQVVELLTRELRDVARQLLARVIDHLLDGAELGATIHHLGRQVDLRGGDADGAQDVATGLVAERPVLLALGHGLEHPALAGRVLHDLLGEVAALEAALLGGDLEGHVGDLGIGLDLGELARGVRDREDLVGEALGDLLGALLAHLLGPLAGDLGGQVLGLLAHERLQPLHSFAHELHWNLPGRAIRSSRHHEGLYPQDKRRICPFSWKEAGRDPDPCSPAARQQG